MTSPSQALAGIAREAEQHVERALVRLEGVDPQPIRSQA